MKLEDHCLECVEVLGEQFIEVRQEPPAKVSGVK